MFITLHRGMIRETPRVSLPIVFEGV